MLCRKYSVGQNSHTGTDPKAGEDTRASPACIGLCPHCTIPPPSPPLRCRHPRAHFPSQDHDKPRGKDLSLIHLGIQPKLTTQMALLDGGFYRILQTCFYLCFNRWCCSVTQSCPTLWDPWTAACQASLFFIISRSLLKLISTELVMPSTHLILCYPLLLLLSIFPSITVSFMSQFFSSGDQIIGDSSSASVLPMNIQGWFPLGLTGLISLQSKGLSRVFSNTTVQKHQFFSAQLSL